MPAIQQIKHSLIFKAAALYKALHTIKKIYLWTYSLIFAWEKTPCSLILWFLSRYTELVWNNTKQSSTSFISQFLYRIHVNIRIIDGSHMIYDTH